MRCAWNIRTVRCDKKKDDICNKDQKDKWGTDSCCFYAKITEDPTSMVQAQLLAGDYPSALNKEGYFCMKKADEALQGYTGYTTLTNDGATSPYNYDKTKLRGTMRVGNGIAKFRGYCSGATLISVASSLTAFAYLA